jgi:hypothetical protein
MAKPKPRKLPELDRTTNEKPITLPVDFTRVLRPLLKTKPVPRVQMGKQQEKTGS